MTKWPTKKNLDKILPKLEKEPGTQHLNKNASALERFRWELCQHILKYQIKSNLKQKELAELLDVDEPQMSRILRHQIDKVSTDKLAKMVLILNPDVKLKVS